MEESDTKESVEVMGEEVGKVYNCLYNDLVWLCSRWDMYKKLYNNENVPLLNKTAPFFFYLIQDALFKLIVLEIARITDPSKTCGKKNLTFLQLPQLVPENIKDNIKKLTESVKSKCAFAREWRNKSIAHNDLNHRIDPKKNPIRAISREQIDDALNAFKELMNAINLNYFNSVSTFEINDKKSEINGLIYFLQMGCNLENELKEKIDSEMRP